MLEGRAAAVERLGNETYVYLEVPGSNEFAVHAAGDVAVQPGDLMRIGIILPLPAMSSMRQDRRSNPA